MGKFWLKTGLLSMFPLLSFDSTLKAKDENNFTNLTLICSKTVMFYETGCMYAPLTSSSL